MRRKRCRKSWGCQDFHEAGYRFTAVREAIINIMENSDTHLSVDDIYNKVKKQHDGVNLTTIYRNLEILINMGIVLKYDFGDGRARYELVSHFDKKPFHIHLICKSCGRVIDVEDFMCEHKNKKVETIKKKYKFLIDEEIHQFRGICSNCS
ncbi:Fur family transcriptional regulator [bacterium]